jgi:hypothetical protein
MLHWQRQVFDCAARMVGSADLTLEERREIAVTLLRALGPRALAQIREDLATVERDEAIAPGAPSDAVPIKGSYRDDGFKVGS